MDISTKNNESVGKNFNPRLKRMLQVLLFVAFGLLVYVIFSSIKSDANPVYVTAGLLVGVGIGLIFARMFKITWDENVRQVVYRMDVIGVVLLVVFIVFDLTRSSIVSDIVSGPSVKPTSFAILAGTFYGRVFGMRRNIIAVLRQQQLLPAKKTKHNNK